jgi:hypothetical protein
MLRLSAPARPPQRMSGRFARAGETSRTLVACRRNIMTGGPIAQGLVVRFERGLRPRNLFRRDARKGDSAPLRVC